MIKINGTALPEPGAYTVSIMDLSKNAERNANGDMIIERVATKRKLELSWMFLTQNDLTRILNLVSPVFFTVEYPDPQTGTTRTGTFYCGDRTCPGLDYKDGQIRWKDVKFNLIER